MTPPTCPKCHHKPSQGTTTSNGLMKRCRCDCHRLADAAPALLEAARKAMLCLTGEDEEDWRRSQSWPESPYGFLYDPIAAALGWPPREPKENSP